MYNFIYNYHKISIHIYSVHGHAISSTTTKFPEIENTHQTKPTYKANANDKGRRSLMIVQKKRCGCAHTVPIYLYRTGKRIQNQNQHEFNTQIIQKSMQ